MSVFWVRVLAGLGVLGVVAMGVHAAATLSLYSFLYAVLCGAMTATWLTLRRDSDEAARAADPLFLMALFFVGRVAAPAFTWFEGLF